MKRLQLFWNFIKDERNIILTLIGLISIGFICWISSEKTENFGLNFFTEMLGVSVTVFIVDRLIQKREEKRNTPQKLAAYEDVRLYTSRYISFWTETYRQSVPHPDPETIEDFFSENGMSKILNYLYMDSDANVAPPQKWCDWLVNNAKEFKNNGDKILDRHSHNLDPVAFGFLHQLTESSFNNVLLLSPSVRQFDIASNIPRVKVLGSYSLAPLSADFEAIIGLVNWCNQTYQVLLKQNKAIKKVKEYKPNKDRKMTPKSMIPPDIFEKQVAEFQKFSQQTK